MFRVRSGVAKDQHVATGHTSSRLRKGQNSWPPHKSTHTMVGLLARGLLLAELSVQRARTDYDRDARCKFGAVGIKFHFLEGPGGFPELLRATVPSLCLVKNRVRLNWRDHRECGCDI